MKRILSYEKLYLVVAVSKVSSTFTDKENTIYEKLSPTMVESSKKSLMDKLRRFTRKKGNT